MGLFDYVSVSGPQFVCSEGHYLGDEEFQTKDLGCTMGSAHIGEAVEVFDGGYGDTQPNPFTDTIEIYCNCSQCPALVQYGTGNFCPTSVEFEVEVVDSKVKSVRRISMPTPEQIQHELAQPYMKDCEGPMTCAAARERHIDYPQEIRDAWREQMRLKWAVKP